MLKWINKKRNQKGFTLIELIVVIAILGILAAIAIPRLTGLTNTTRVKADLASARVIESAVRIHQADTGKLPGADTTYTVSAFIDKYLDGVTPKMQGDYSASVTVDGVTIVDGADGFYMDGTGKVTVAKAGTKITK